MGKCIFFRAWIGPCNQESEGSMCEEHANVKCCSCGEPATQECDHTGGLVCGAPLCGDCMHHPPGPDDINILLMGGGHARKSVAEPAWEKRWEEFNERLQQPKEPQ